MRARPTARLSATGKSGGASAWLRLRGRRSFTATLIALSFLSTVVPSPYLSLSLSLSAPLSSTQLLIRYEISDITVLSAVQFSPPK